MPFSFPFLILSLAAIGVNILIGYCGQISLGSGAFMAIGAYCAYKFGTGIHIPLGMVRHRDQLPPLPLVLSILLGGLMSSIVGILFGVPSLRIKGLYLAVATLAAQFFFDWVFLRVQWFTNYAPSGSDQRRRNLRIFGYLVNSLDRALSALPRRSWRCSRSSQKTSCAAISDGSGWRSATWISPPS